jgi:dihydropteroate synthase
MKTIIKGHWRNIRVLAEVPVIEASYDRIKNWEMDPRGYFLIKVDREMSLIRVAFCALPGDVMQTEITGTNALDIVNTLIREDMLSTLQHAADMGVELHKAELALQHGWEYVQDQALAFRSGEV